MIELRGWIISSCKTHPYPIHSTASFRIRGRRLPHYPLEPRSHWAHSAVVSPLCHLLEPAFLSHTQEQWITFTTSRPYNQGIKEEHPITPKLQLIFYSQETRKGNFLLQSYDFKKNPILISSNILNQDKQKQPCPSNIRSIKKINIKFILDYSKTHITTRSND